MKLSFGIWPNLFAKTNCIWPIADTDYTMYFTLNFAFLHMIQELWPGDF